MSSVRFARQYALPEIGTTGQQKIERGSVRAAGGDPRATEIALAYVTRAGATIADEEGATVSLEVASTDRVRAIAGRPELVEAAAFLAGSLAATSAIATLADVRVRPVTRVPTLTE